MVIEALAKNLGVVPHHKIRLFYKEANGISPLYVMQIT